MEFIEGLFSRKSIRKFTGEMISDDDLRLIMKAANAAPVARGRYDTLHLTVISNPELLNKIDRLTGEYLGSPNAHPLYCAPLLIIVSYKVNNGMVDNVNYSDAAIVAHNMALAAMSLDIGTCLIWGAIRAVNECPEILAELNLPDGFKPSCAIILGTTEDQYSLREIDDTRISQNTIV